MIARAHRDRLIAVAMAVVAVGILLVVTAWWHEPTVITHSLGESRELNEAQEQTIDMVKELNAYLVSTATLMFGGLGWYLTQQRRSQSMWLQTMFFAAAALLATSFWYAAMTYVELTAELGQNLLGLEAERSRVLYYLEMEITSGGVAALLILIVFADTVTRQKQGPGGASA